MVNINYSCLTLKVVAVVHILLYIKVTGLYKIICVIRIFNQAYSI